MSMCVESIDYFVLVNNKAGIPIIPGRGLDQGDPMSPYMFIICAELIRDVVECGVIIGTSICGAAPPVSHMLFVDDCFLFFKADEGQTQVMKSILVAYEATSGQTINLPKLEIFVVVTWPQI
jgi:hypothetical protein